MRIRQTLLAVLSLVAASTASAGTVVCSGVVDTISYHANGQFMFKLSSMNNAVLFCSGDADWNVTPGYTTTQSTCKMLFATFLAARESGRPINSVYMDGPDVPATCDAWGAWKYVNIRHFLY